MSKTIDLQPWLDYFEMLQTYEKNGFLEVFPDKGEAYVTEAALNTLSNTDTSPQLRDNVLEGARRLRSYTAVLRYIRAYAAWRSRKGSAYLESPFALQIVTDENPHYVQCTLLMTVRRRWWRLWRKADYVEVIPVTEKRRPS